MVCGRRLGEELSRNLEGGWGEGLLFSRDWGGRDCRNLSKKEARGREKKGKNYQLTMAEYWNAGCWEKSLHRLR